MVDRPIVRNGRLAGAGIHDAVVDSFSLGESRFTLKLRSPEGDIRLVHLLGLQRIGFERVLNGMIISDIFVWDRDKFQEIPIEVLSIVAGHDLRIDYAEEYRNSILDSESDNFILLESSYGGRIAAICRSVSTEISK